MSGAILTAKRWYGAYTHVLQYGKPALLLIARLLIGWGFILAGSGKLDHPDAAAKQFAEWGIPMPLANAYLAGTAETVCGFLLMLGAASRLITIPLLGTMIVAYATANKAIFAGIWENRSGFLQALVRADPFPYLLVVLVVLLFGPGLFSVDGFLSAYTSANYIPPTEPLATEKALDRRDLNRLAFVALGGLAAGVIGIYSFAGTSTGKGAGKGKGPGKDNNETAADEGPLLLQDPHVCRGINTCKNKGKSGTTNECAGQGHCATAAAHSCQGQNDCKGQGGCGEHPGENACKGQGACAVPLDAGDKMTWQKARKHFEELRTKANKKFGEAPAS